MKYIDKLIWSRAELFDFFFYCGSSILQYNFPCGCHAASQIHQKPWYFFLLCTDLPGYKSDKSSGKFPLYNP